MIQVLFNSQSMMCKASLKKLLNKELPERDDMNFVELDMGKERLADLAEECLSLPLGYEKKVIVAENFYYLAKAKTKAKLMKGDEDETLISYFKNPDPAITVFILVYANDLDKKNSLYEALEEGGATFTQIATFTAEQWPQIAVKYFQKNGASIDNDAAVELVSRIGGDYSTFLNEADKLLTYAKGENVTKDMVEMLVSQPLEDDMFQLSNALTRGDKKKAFKVYKDLKVKNIRGITLMNALAKQLQFLHEVQYLYGTGMPSPLIAKELGCTPGRVNASLYSVRKMRDVSLERGLEALYQAELAVMSGQKDEDLAFNMFLANFEL
ncbi:MAG: DNA polymerase III subunit delta [Bacilli bacterium]|nr:DNA polymerase III subunit delta [Bacilli bacterium]